MAEHKIKVTRNAFTKCAAGTPFQLVFQFVPLICSQVGIIGGSGLDDPEILDGRKEIYLETPYGTYWPVPVLEPDQFQ